MQKHQWRQHGIVHFKSRPPLLPGQVEPSSPIPQPPPHPGMTTSNPTLGGIIGTAEGVVFNSIVDRIKNNSIESYHDSSSRGLDRSGPPPPPPPPAAHALAAASMVEDDVEEEDSIHGIDLSAASSRQHPEPRPAHGANQSGSQHAQQQQLEAQHPHHNPSLPQMHHDYLPPSPPQPQEKPVSPPRVEFQPLPSQISNFLLLQQHQEHQEQRDQLRREEQEQEASDDTEPSPNSRLLINLPSSPEDGGRPESPTDHSQLQQQQQQQHPIKMKKMLAHAYQREIEEQRTDSMSSEDDQDQLSNPGGSNSGSEKDLVECQCKSCGNVFAVHDPYNFRCTHCHVKYSSLPTHMIADPLQCIGCCQVFPHKPALKSHQICNEKERPFRCCKCGYRFRQKAHLQKHQWRIHRRKLEPEPSEIQQQQQQHSQQTSDQQQQLSLRSNNSSSIAKTITIQDIIDHGVERGLGPSSRPHAMDSSSVARFSVRTPSPERHPHGDNAGDRAAGNSLQPLDLSPVKTSSQSSISRGKNEANPSSFSSPSSASSPPSSSSSPYQDDSNQNASLPCLPAWKKPRTSPGPAPPTTAGIGTHRTLPPITPSWLSPTATTTKPMTLMTPDATTATTNEDEDMTPTNLKVKQQGRIDNNATDMVKTNFDTPCRTLDIRNV